MSEAPRDQNRVTTLIATSNADGTTPVPLWADPVTHRLLVDATGGSTFYTDTLSGTIDGANKTFTVANTITSALALYIANSVYQPVVDFTTSGTTITMVVAPDVSLSGQPAWLLHT